MPKTLKTVLAGSVLLMGGLVPALGADVYDPPYYIEPAPPVVYEAPSYGGWYLRGDVGYRWSDLRGVEYIRYGLPPSPGRFDRNKLDDGFSVGGGVGYKINDYLRADLTADYWLKSDFRGSTSGWLNGQPVTSRDTSKFSALLLLANAYADLGTYGRFTPYVGAGIGGAHVKWDTLRNRIDPGIDDRHRGAKGWRFAWALMAGTSYCVTRNWHADVGYRFTNIEGGRMFEYVSSSGGGTGAGPGFHKDIRTHEVRAGLRYQFGGSGGGECGEEPIYTAYEPEPLPLPVYK